MVSSTLKFGSGQAVERLEDAQLLQGKGMYTDDVDLLEQTRLCFVRSPYPHARIASIDTAAAAAMPSENHLRRSPIAWFGAHLAQPGTGVADGMAGVDDRGRVSDPGQPRRLHWDSQRAWIQCQ